jgi:transposase
MAGKINASGNEYSNTNTRDLFYKSNLMEKYIDGKITAKKIAAILSIKTRQVRRLVRSYKEKGKTSLIHGLKNKPSNHSIEKETKERVIELIKQDKYKDFGPTLLSEYLCAYEHINVNHETLRRLMNKDKLQTFKRKRRPYRTKRERKEYFGEMLQIDGSFHRWFTSEELKDEDRKACLINLIDDSTNVNLMLFDKQETMTCACKVLWLWLCKYGIPQSIYCDKRNMYLSNKDTNRENREKIELNNPKGYFRIMCTNLNITIIQANSPQAKGRVERGNKTHQDRLVKALRFNNIVNIEEANRFLLNEYINEHNKKFSIPLAENRIANVHRPLDNDITLNNVCYVEEIRKVNNDWTISYKGRLYQLKKQSQYHPPCKSTVYVRKDIEGNISIFYRNIAIEYTVLR